LHNKQQKEIIWITNPGNIVFSSRKSMLICDNCNVKMLNFIKIHLHNKRQKEIICNQNFSGVIVLKVEGKVEFYTINIIIFKIKLKDIYLD